MPLDTMVPKAAEADTQFEKDAHWAVKNVYGMNKWSVADIQRAHLSALAIAIQNIHHLLLKMVNLNMWVGMKYYLTFHLKILLMLRGYQFILVLLIHMLIFMTWDTI